jgi:hypothetical protein
VGDSPPTPAPPPVDEAAPQQATSSGLKDPDELYYKHSGMVGCAGPFFLTIIGTVAAIVAGIIYGYAVFYIPIVYFNFLLTILLGMAVAFALRFAGKLGKVRHIGVMALFGFVLGLVAKYSGSVAWISAVMEDPSLLLSFFFPGEVFSILRLISMVGAWSIFSWTPTGPALYAIWGVEVLLIVGTATLGAASSLMSAPFCERCNRWAKQAESLFPLEPIADPIKLRAQLERGDFASINSLRRIAEGSKTYTRLDLYQCTTCQEFHLLTAKSVRTEVDSRGRESKKEEKIVENLLLDAEAYEMIRAAR